jgi:hypothetical protein
LLFVLTSLKRTFVGKISLLRYVLTHKNGIHLCDRCGEYECEHADKPHNDPSDDYESDCDSDCDFCKDGVSDPQSEHKIDKRFEDPEDDASSVSSDDTDTEHFECRTHNLLKYKQPKFTSYESWSDAFGKFILDEIVTYKSTGSISSFFLSLNTQINNKNYLKQFIAKLKVRGKFVSDVMDLFSKPTMSDCIQMQFLLDDVDQFIVTNCECSCDDPYYIICKDRLYAGTKCDFKCEYRTISPYLHEIILPFTVNKIEFKNNLFVCYSSLLIYFLNFFTNDFYYVKNKYANHNFYYNPLNKTITGISINAPTNKCHDLISIDHGITTAIKEKRKSFIPNASTLIEVFIGSCTVYCHSKRRMASFTFSVDSIMRDILKSPMEICGVYESVTNYARDEDESDDEAFLFVLVKGNPNKQIVPCVNHNSFVLINVDIWDYFYAHCKVPGDTRDDMFFFMSVNSVVYLICNKKLTHGIYLNYLNATDDAWVDSDWNTYIISHPLSKIKYIDCCLDAFILSDGLRTFIYKNFLDENIEVIDLMNNDLRLSAEFHSVETGADLEQRASVLVSKQTSALEQMFTLLDMHRITATFDYYYAFEGVEIALGHGVAADFLQRVWMEFNAEYLMCHNHYCSFSPSITRVTPYRLKLIGRMLFLTVCQGMKIPYRMPLDLIATFSSNRMISHSGPWDISNVELEYFASIENAQAYKTMKAYRYNSIAFDAIESGHQSYSLALKSLVHLDGSSTIRAICRAIYEGFLECDGFIMDNLTNLSMKEFFCNLTMPLADHLISGPVVIDNIEVVSVMRVIIEDDITNEKIRRPQYVHGIWCQFIMSLDQQQLKNLLFNWTSCTNPDFNEVELIVRITNISGQNYLISTCERSITLHPGMLAHDNFSLFADLITSCTDTYLVDD